MRARSRYWPLFLAHSQHVFNNAMVRGFRRPTSGKWRKVLQPLVPSQNLEADTGPIPQELNLAWAGA